MGDSVPRRGPARGDHGFDAPAREGTILIETSNASFDTTWCEEQIDFLPGDHVILSVCDNGTGVETVYGIVKQNHGFIHVGSKPEEGTCLEIHLPRHGSRHGTKLLDASGGG